MLLISWVTLLLWFYYGTKLSCFVDECVNRLSCTKKIEKECRGLVCWIKKKRSCGLWVLGPPAPVWVNWMSAKCLTLYRMRTPVVSSAIQLMMLLVEFTSGVRGTYLDLDRACMQD